MRLIEPIRQDVAYGIRQLVRNPAFACPAILILALGIAAATAIFSIAYGVLLRDLPYDQPGRLIGIGVLTDTDNTGEYAEAWYGDIQLLQERFSHHTATGSQPLPLSLSQRK